MVSLGFIYLKDHGIPQPLIDSTFSASQHFFDLPAELKMKIQMVNSPHFVGYNLLGNEVTNLAVDYREQIDFGSDAPLAPPNSPFYANLLGPNQFLPDEECPGFKETVLAYRDACRNTGFQLLHAMSLSLGLVEDYFDSFFVHERTAHRMKLAKYPSVTNISRLHDGDDAYLTSSDSNADLSQGVGPHRDSGFITLISQDTIGGLQVQLFDGTWADVPPKPGTLVVNLGEMSSALTGGLFVATTHRVLNNASGKTRYSIPFFLAPHLDAELLPIPKHLLPPDLVTKMPLEVKTDVHAKRAKTYARYGLNYMKGRLRSHPDVARRWWSHVDPEGLDVWEMELEKVKVKM
jgi:isopenicillin N synthase-like dioxygenase